MLSFFVVCFSPGKSFHFRSKFNFGKNGPRATADVANSLLCRRWFKHRFRFTNSYVFQCLDLTGCGDGGSLCVAYVSVLFVYVCTYVPVVTCGMCVCVLCACLYIRLWFSVSLSIYT